MGQTGTLVGAQVQDTTTTTGTGAITLAGVVPAGAPAGSTTFAQQFGSGAQSAPGNTFYAIIDGSGNIEVGLGTFNGSTTLTRDYVLGTYTGGVISLATQVAPGTQLNFAAGTKNVYSNTNLFAQSVAAWCRVPDDNAANVFQNIMSGTFTGVLTMGAGTTNLTIRYKVTNEGVCWLQIPAGTANGAATTVTITGIPAFLCNVLTQQFPIAQLVSNAVQLSGNGSIAAGATPTSTGTITLNVLTGATPPTYAAAGGFTTGTASGFTNPVCVAYPLF